MEHDQNCYFELFLTSSVSNIPLKKTVSSVERIYERHIFTLQREHILFSSSSHTVVSATLAAEKWYLKNLVGDWIFQAFISLLLRQRSESITVSSILEIFPKSPDNKEEYRRSNNFWSSCVSVVTISLYPAGEGGGAHCARCALCVYNKLNTVYYDMFSRRWKGSSNGKLTTGHYNACSAWCNSRCCGAEPLDKSDCKWHQY